LAAAVRVARREGLNLPIPATLVFPQSDASNEDDWQEVVLRHLGIDDWERIEIHDELDAVGPVATAAFERHGLLWPFNAHLHLPIIERAAGGSVVTGFGGDELGNATSSARAERLLSDRQRPTTGDLLVLGLALSPSPVRSLVHRHRARADLGDTPWLTEEGGRQLMRAYGASVGSIPLGWESVIRKWIWPSRYFRVCERSFAVMGEYHDVVVAHPFVDARFLDSVAAFGGFRGLGDRSDLMRAIFGELLPDELIERQTKGSFTDPLLTETAMDFAREWSGYGIDTSLVDPVLLRSHWLGGTPNVRSTTLLQAAWIHDHLSGKLAGQS
jgi:asparagine synthase (glutamine-hydrolysing)